jgi:hypothetical protein
MYKRSYLTSIIMDAVSIRDTNAHASKTVSVEGMLEKSFYVNNDLNQSVSIQIQGCHINSGTEGDWVNIGEAQAVTADTKTIIGVNEVAVLKNYFPWIRVVATCSSGPNAHSITVILMAVA